MYETIQHANSEIFGINLPKIIENEMLIKKCLHKHIRDSDKIAV